MVEVTTTCIKGLLRNAENHCFSVTGVALELATDTLIGRGYIPIKPSKVKGLQIEKAFVPPTS